MSAKIWLSSSLLSSSSCYKQANVKNSLVKAAARLWDFDYLGGKYCIACDKSFVFLNVQENAVVLLNELGVIMFGSFRGNFSLPEHSGTVKDG